ncbi:unnamed protein product [Schistosoma margrebowiei]|uniref:Uncharacterized protein n=1 Tax=Schistosoma margrebowiei TaxID=48269 RepID=A0A3P7YA22_9TREM|nr:unnamed protein product [Schistosoma margrebowiei]
MTNTSNQILLWLLWIFCTDINLSIKTQIQGMQKYNP